MDSSTIRVTSDPDSIDLALAHRWITSTYWAKGIPWERFERACSNSLVFAAFDGSEQVGFARVVTDTATFAWLADVFVPERARGRGIARRLLEAIVADHRLQGLRQFVLGTRDAHGLYEKFGFERLGEPDGRFMRILRTPAEAYGTTTLMAEGDHVERTQRLVFGEDAELYDRARPSYPDALVDDVVGLVGGGRAHAVDAGCGTGKATVLLAVRGVTGVAVEPDPAMAAVARRNLAASPGWRVDVSGFEGWSPAPGDPPFDLVVSAQAWHWFEPGVRFRKAHDLLRPGGWLALWWNTPAVLDSPVRQAIDAAYNRFAPEITFRGTAGHPGEEFGPMPPGITFDAPEERSYPWSAAYTATAWVDLMRTSSDHRMLPEARRERVLEAVGLAIDAHGGIYELGYVCELWTARRR